MPIGYTKPFSLILNELVRGGGKVYLEAFHKNQDPILNKSNGIYIYSFDTPEIIRIEWTDNNDKPIEGEVKEGSYVFLHIYTKNLYGQKLKIQLMDNDHGWFNSDDKLSNENNSKAILYSINADVDLYEVSQIDKNDAILGTLTQSDNINITNVQKAIVRVQVDPLIYTAGKLWGTNSSSKWKSEGGTNLEIYPIITTPTWDGSKEYPIKGNYLKVDYNNKNSPSYDIPDYRSPIKIGQVTTNMAEFHSCGYNTITISDDDRSEVIIFEKGKTEVKNKFEIIAGKITKKVTIKLDDTASTNDCDGKGNGGEIHKGHVFEISGFSEQDSDDKNKPEVKDEKQDSKWSAKTEVEISAGSVSSKNTINYSFNNGKPGIVFNTDKEVVLSLNYKYNTLPIEILDIVGLPAMLRYIWIGEDYATQDYKVVVSSCRYLRHQFAIKVYPDVSWALFFAYEMDDDEEPSKTKEIASNQAYKDTRRASFKRDEAKWIPVGDKQLGVHLVAKSNFYGDEEDEEDVSAKVEELFKKMMEPVNAALNLFKKIFMGQNNAADSSNGDTSQARNAVDNINRNVSNDATKEEKQKELKKLWENFDKNKKRQRSDNDTTRKNAEKDSQYLQRKMDKSGLVGIRSPLKVEITTPQFAVGVDWRRVPISNPEYSDFMNSTGMIVQGTIIFDPLFKVAIVLDFLALAQRAHPLALALIAALDIALKLTGDGSEMTLDLTVTGTVGGKFTGFLNTLTKENTFSKRDKNSREDAFAEVNGELAFQIKANITIKYEKRVVIIFVGDTVTEVEVVGELKAEASFSGKATLDFDSQGLFIQPEGGFDGLKFQGKASAKGEIKVGKRGGSISGEANVIYQAIDKQDPKKLDKFYCLRNK